MKLSDPRRIAVAIGGNIGSDEELVSRFRAVIRLLAGRGAFDCRASRVYQSLPVGPITTQPRFLNAVVTFQLPAAVTPMALLGWLWQFEASLGRRRPAWPRQGPRTIDLDLIVFRRLTTSTLALTLPHPRAAGRSFVMRPLSELDVAISAPPADDCRPLEGVLLLDG